jgi:tetratricopeptide (TPR) repeat protein
MEKSFKALTSGMGLARDQDFAHLNTWLLSGVGILRQEQGQSLEALDIFQDLVQYDPNNGLLLMNLAVGLCAVGKNSEGLRQGARAVLRDPRSAPLWNTLGHLQLSLGKSDEAVDCFEKAASLVSSAAIYRESLAAAYQRMGLTDEALAQVEAARNLQNAPYDRSGILIKAIRGNTAGAAEQLSAAVSAGLISKASLGHDANLNTILDPVQITEGL